MTGGTRVMDVASTYTVGQVAQLLGVSVRTLHHYDQIGLLTPSGRSRTGYRLYTEADLVRLQQVVVYRRLELSLDEIAQLLADGSDPAEHLRRQRSTVIARLDELHELVTAIDRALEREMNERPATPHDLKELFGDGFTDEYEAEAQEHWGETDAWKQSASRTKGYTKADWEAVKAEMEAVTIAFVGAKRAGLPATSSEAMDAAEAARRHIQDRFYDLSYEMHKGLGEMYVEDPRFTKRYEDLEPGLSAYVRDAIHANAARHGS